MELLFVVEVIWAMTAGLFVLQWFLYSPIILIWLWLNGWLSAKTGQFTVEEDDFEVGAFIASPLIFAAIIFALAKWAGFDPLPEFGWADALRFAWQWLAMGAVYAIIVGLIFVIPKKRHQFDDRMESLEVRFRKDNKDKENIDELWDKEYDRLELESRPTMKSSAPWIVAMLLFWFWDLIFRIFDGFLAEILLKLRNLLMKLLGYLKIFNPIMDWIWKASSKKKKKKT